MNRPTGVTVISILYFLGAACMVLLGVLLLVGGGMAGAAMKDSGSTGGMALLATMGVAGAIACFVLALLPGAVGWGMWSLKNWARIAALVLAILGLLTNGLGLLGSLLHFEIVTFTIGAIIVGIYIWVVLYLLKPHVKTAFGAA
jgi:hypothetical protein